MPRQGRVTFNTSFLLYIYLRLLLYSVIGSGIPLGSKLSVEEGNYWTSSNGDFAIGFFNSSNLYSVGIRFVSSTIPESKQMVVWVAGGDLRVGNRSYLQFTEKGELILYNSAAETVAWTTETGNASVVSAVLRDDGNLVLLNREKDIIWQSFDTPSDTLLPGQNLSVHQTLRPHSTNSVSSYYSLFMAASGRLLLRWETSVIYWSSGSFESAHRAMLKEDGTLQLLDQSSKPIWSIFGKDHNDSDVKFRFLRLDSDGNLRLYSWQDASKSWIYGWQAFENQCDIFATCSLQGICLFDASGSPFCKCPFAYSGQSNAKCLVPYQDSCESGFSMITYEHTSLYGIYPPNETIVKTSLRQCKILCQEDPSCSAATFINNGSAGCRIIKTRYISGQSNPTLGYVSFVKSCSDPIAVPIPKPSSEKDIPKASRRFCFPCLMGIAAGTVIVFVIIQFGVMLLILRRRKRATKKAALLTYVDPSTSGCIMLSYPEIRELTENFKHQIGPKVFKGMLPDNRPVAIKMISTSIDERKFRTAVSKIGSIYHKNLLKLAGFCSDSDRRFLVYEFARNGSLRSCLEDPKVSKRLTWKKRIGISLAVARAVFYLHTGCREFVSHGNLKCENVLLDDNLEAKVSEYTLQFNIQEMSCIGGMAEADVRDFGKILVKLITGSLQDSDSASTCEWAYQMWAAAQTESVVDKRMEGGVNSDELERALRIAFWCLQEDERMRPSMGEVVKVLEGTLPVDTPPPFFFSHCHMNPLEDSTEEEP